MLGRFFVILASMLFEVGGGIGSWNMEMGDLGFQVVLADWSFTA